MKKKMSHLGWGCGIVAAALISACGGSGGGSASSTSTTTQYDYLGTQSPGDLWTATINTDNTFSASNTNSTNAVTFSGTTSLQVSGLTQLVVDTTSDSSKIAVGAIGYVYTIPGTATIMWPPGTTVGTTSNTRPVFLVAQASSAGFSAGMKFNWVDMPTAQWSPGYPLNSSDSTSVDCTQAANGFPGNVLGTATVSSVSGSDISITFDEYDYCGNQSTFSATNSLTDQGSGEIQGTNSGVTITFQVSPSGAFMGDVTAATLQSVAGFIGMKAPSADVDLNTLFSADRTFRGFVFRTVSGSGANYTEPVGATISAGTQTIGGFTMDPESGASAGGNVTIDLGTSQVAPGVFNGATITTSTAHNATFVVNSIDGKYFIFGFGYDSIPFNFMLMEQ